MNKANINGKSYAYARVPAQMSGTTLSTDGVVLMGEDGQLVYLSPEQASVLLPEQPSNVVQMPATPTRSEARKPTKRRLKRKLCETHELVLTAIHTAEVELSAQDIASQIDNEASTVGTALLKLMELGYVSRKSHPLQDGQGRQRLIYHYTLTPMGREAIGA